MLLPDQIVSAAPITPKTHKEGVKTWDLFQAQDLIERPG
jgi:hypothetical protein